MKKLIFLLFVLSLSFSEQLWVSAVSGFPYDLSIYGNSLLVSSDKGISSYSLAGTRRWFLESYSPITIVGDEGLFIAEKNLVKKLSFEGSVLWQKTINASRISALDYFDALYVSTDSGIYKVSEESTERIYSSNGVVSKLYKTSDSFVFIDSNDVVRLSDSGSVVWSTKITGTWLSSPVVSDNLVYVPDISGYLRAFAYSNGREVWFLPVKGWPITDLVVRNAVLYVGTTKGYVYAINKNSGSIIWETKLPAGVKYGFEFGSLGADSVLFLTSSDKSIYAVSVDSGDVLWKAGDGTTLGRPLFNDGVLFVGSSKQNLYAFSTDRACSILTPVEGSVLDNREVFVSGKFTSKFSNPRVQVSTDGINWVDAETEINSWFVYLVPGDSFEQGVNRIFCRVSDSSGAEQGPQYTSVLVFYDSEAPLATISASVPTAIADEPFEILLFDQETGEPLNRFYYVLNGEEKFVGDSLSLTLPPGEYTLTIKKTGYEDRILSISVTSTEVNPLFYVFIFLLVAVAAFFVFKRFKRPSK